VAVGRYIASQGIDILCTKFLFPLPKCIIAHGSQAMILTIFLSVKSMRALTDWFSAVKLCEISGGTVVHTELCSGAH
jgi:hypothetical protein